MRLVLKWVDTDGCTYSCTKTMAVVYSSPEALAVDLEAACASKSDSFGTDVYLPEGLRVHSSHFFYEDQYEAPEIMTVDEWFGKAEKLQAAHWTPLST